MCYFRGYAPIFNSYPQARQTIYLHFAGTAAGALPYSGAKIHCAGNWNTRRIVVVHSKGVSQFVSGGASDSIESRRPDLFPGSGRGVLEQTVSAKGHRWRKRTRAHLPTQIGKGMLIALLYYLIFICVIIVIVVPIVLVFTLVAAS